MVILKLGRVSVHRVSVTPIGMYAEDGESMTDSALQLVGAVHDLLLYHQQPSSEVAIVGTKNSMLRAK